MATKEVRMNRRSIGLKTSFLLMTAIGALFAGFLARVSAQAQLPEGPNRALVERVCAACHDIEMVVVNGRSEAGWDGTIEEMTGYGLRVTPAERALILEYLKTYLPPR